MSDQGWIIKLQESLSEIKLLAANVDTKLDQLSDSVKKLEAGFEDLKSVTNSQETRLVVLEERYQRCTDMMPENLSEDFALMKSQLSSYQRFTWILTTSVVGVVAKLLFDATM